MTTETRKPTPQERKERTADLRKKHQPIFDALGSPDAKFIPKMAHRVKDLDGIYMGFFESELDHEDDVYTEKVSMQMESEDSDRVLYRLRYNPHFKEEYPPSDPMPNGQCRYYVNVEELEAVSMPSKKISTKKAPKKQVSKVMDSGADELMDQMTIRDYAAIHMREPVSCKPWLNDLIKEANLNNTNKF